MVLLKKRTVEIELLGFLHERICMMRMPNGCALLDLE